MSNVIRFPVERTKQAPDVYRHRDWLLRSYAYHVLKLQDVRRQLGLPRHVAFPEELRRERLATHAMHVCDLVLASRDTTGDEHAEQIAESLEALKAYEALRKEEV